MICHSLLSPPGLPVVSVKRYSTGPVISVPMFASIDMDVSLSAVGGERKVAGLGIGGNLSSLVGTEAEVVPVRIPAASLI